MSLSAAQISNPASDSASAPAASLNGEALAVLWCLAVAAPALVREDVDDGFFLEVANLWAQGIPPHLYAFDIKGTAAYAVFAVAVHFFGASLLVLKLCGAAAAALATAALYRMMTRYDRTAALACTIAYPALLQVLGDPVYQVMNAALTLAACRLLPEGRNRSGLISAGFWLGFAFMIKQTCLIDLLFWAAVLLVRNRTRDGWRQVFLLTAAAWTAPLLAVAYFAEIGALPLLLRNLFVIAAGRSEHYDMSGVWTVVFSHDAVLAGVLLPALLCLRLRAQGALPIAPVAAWLACEQASEMLQGAHWWTYATPSLAPALILATTGVCAWGRSLGRSERSVLATFLFAALLIPLQTRGRVAYLLLPTEDRALLADFAATVEGAAPGREDRLLALNGSALPNIAAHLPPPTPIFHFEHVMCPFSGAGLPALRANFAARPKFVVYEHVHKNLSCVTSETNAVITQALQDYDLLRAGRSTQQDYEIYRHKP